MPARTTARRRLWRSTAACCCRPRPSARFSACPPNGGARGGQAGTGRHGSGAAPGVEVVHPGSLLHSARGGTIVFRNVDELPVRVQARLATLFRDREFKTRLNGGAQHYGVRPAAIVEPAFHRW